ncbi:choice-of-anchor A family protein [Streptomyces sp. NPDC001880]
MGPEPTTEQRTKSSRAAWPGSVLAPRAHLELGTGAPVNGSVWVASLHGSGGAETRHFPFTGCLPETGETPPPTTPSGTPLDHAAHLSHAVHIGDSAGERHPVREHVEPCRLSVGLLRSVEEAGPDNARTDRR